MQPTSLNFKENAARALDDPQLQRALSHVKAGFIAKRTDARAALPEFDALRAGRSRSRTMFSIISISISKNMSAK